MYRDARVNATHNYREPEGDLTPNLQQIMTQFQDLSKSISYPHTTPKVSISDYLCAARGIYLYFILFINHNLNNPVHP